jgi:RimJ/RimL family protein N-acetyltransferase
VQKALDAELILENERVALRPFSRAEGQRLLEYALDPAVWTYFVYRVGSAAEFATYLDDIELQQRNGARHTYVVVDKQTGAAVGSSAYGNISRTDSRIEIGWTWLASAYLGSAINANAKFLLLSYAFEHLDMQRVEFKTDVLNLRARTALKKIGATEEGVLRSHTLMPGGRRRDTIYYSILRNEWPTLKGGVFEGLSALQPVPST